MSLPLLALKPKQQTGVILDDERLDLDTLVSIITNTDCASALGLSAVNQQLRTLMLLPEFWQLVVNLRLEQGEAIGTPDAGRVLTPFQQYFLMCFRKERTDAAQKRAATAQLRLSVETQRWPEAKLALELDADPSVISLDELRPRLFNSFEFIATDGTWALLDPRSPLVEFAKEWIKRGGKLRVLRLSDNETNRIIESAVFSLDPLLITLAANSELVYTPGDELSLVRNRSLLWDLLKGSREATAVEKVLLRRASRLQMTLERRIAEYISVEHPFAPAVGSAIQVAELVFLNGTEVGDVFRDATRVRIEDRLKNQALVDELRDKSARREWETRQCDKEATLRREEAENRRQANQERAERDRERQKRVAETRRRFNEKLADAKAQIERVELAQQSADNEIEDLERRIRGEDPFLEIELKFDRAFDDADWPTLRASIVALIDADERRAAVSVQRRQSQLAVIPQFAADDELIMRMLSSDESTTPNLADLARELILGD